MVVHELQCLAQLYEVELACALRVLGVHDSVEQLASCQKLQNQNHPSRLLKGVVELQQSRMLQFLHDGDFVENVSDFAHFEIDVLAGECATRNYFGAAHHPAELTRPQFLVSFVVLVHSLGGTFDDDISNFERRFNLKWNNS